MSFKTNKLIGSSNKTHAIVLRTLAMLRLTLLLSSVVVRFLNPVTITSLCLSMAVAVAYAATSRRKENRKKETL